MRDGLDHPGDSLDRQRPPHSVQRVERNGPPSHPVSSLAHKRLRVPKEIPIKEVHHSEPSSVASRLKTATSTFDSPERLSPFLSSGDLLGTFPHPPTTIAMVGPFRILFGAAALLLGLVSLVTVEAQSSSSSSSPTPPSVSLSISTTTSISNVVSGSRTLQTPTVFPVTYTYPLSSSSSGTSTPTSLPAETSSPAQIRLDTKLDPGFGVLGALLILTGFPSAFLGHKNRWYTLDFSTM